MGKLTQEINKPAYDVVPRQDLNDASRDFEFPNRDTCAGFGDGDNKKLSGIQKEYMRQIRKWLSDMFEHFNKKLPGHVIKWKDIEDLFYRHGQPISRAHYAAQIASIKKEFNNVGYTLYNVHGVGYCIATPEQHKHEVLKSQARAGAFLLSAKKLSGLSEFKECNRYDVRYKLIQVFSHVTKVYLRQLEHLSVTEQKEYAEIISDVSSPEFLVDSEFLNRVDKIKAETGIDAQY